MNVSDENCRESQNAHFMFINFFFQKSCCLLDNVETYCTVTQNTDSTVLGCMHSSCRITNATNRICNTYCFSKAKVVPQTCLILHVHCTCTLPVWFVIKSFCTTFYFQLDTQIYYPVKTNLNVNSTVFDNFWYYMHFR
jgi:hypothetical protein